MSNTDGPEERPAPNAVSTSDEVTIRRAPKFGAFIIGGAVLGFVATLVVVSATMGIDRGDQQETASFGQLVGYFSLYGVTIGAAVGAVVAIVLDRALGRRSAALTAERVEVEPAPETVDGELEEPGARGAGPDDAHTDDAGR